MHALEVLTKEKALEFAMLEDDPAAEIAKVERLYASPEVRGGRPIPNGRLRFTKTLILISRILYLYSIRSDTIDSFQFNFFFLNSNISIRSIQNQ